MTLEETLQELEAQGDEKVRAQNVRWGASDNQYGVKLGEIRKLAKTIKANPELAAELWDTGNVDARFLAILLLKPRQLSSDDVDALVRSVAFSRVADWLIAYVVRKHPEKEALRERWMQDDHPMAARACWDLTAERVSKDAEGLDPSSLLDRIESEMADADPLPQWTMNAALAGIGIHHPDLRARAMEIGESLGVFRDYPTSKGCTSPFAPIWIEEMVRRQG
ncbi:MAG: DNA alkylation repair protein [Planctomycetota bacterium]